MLKDPSKVFFLDTTSRPFIYWVGVGCQRIVPGDGGFQLASACFVALATLALGLAYDASRRAVRPAIFRLLGLAFIAFLPQTVIATVIFAADAAAALPFVLAGWSLVRALEADSKKPALRYAWLCGLALAFGDICKATFGLLPFAILLPLFALWRAKALGLWSAAGFIAITIFLPTIVAVAVAHAARVQLASAPPRHEFDWKGTGEMTFRSLLAPRSSDVLIFRAPPYGWRVTENGKTKFPILIENNLSYPALFHLGVFTDILNHSQNRLDHPLDIVRNGAPKRPPLQHWAARIAVSVGTPFTLLMAVGVLVSGYRILHGIITPAATPSVSLLVWSAFAWAWFGPIFGTLPFVHHVYAWGYWLPRLILPAVWVAYFGLFGLLASWSGHRVKLVAAVTSLVVILLIASEIRSIWF
jgi:hypothetical protein